MRALVLKEFGRMSVEELPTPSPDSGHILIRVKATGICGSDLHGFTGENGRRVIGQVMGHESVGTIVELGERVDPVRFIVGSTVTFNPVLVPEDQANEYKGREQHAPGKKVIGVAPDIIAAFAEFISVPSTNVVVLPESMPVNYGALIEPMAVALHAVRRVDARPGDKILVIGGGPIGQSTILAAQFEGIEDILVSEIDEARRELCATLGATVIDPSTEPVSQQVIRSFGQLADVTIDAVGISGTISDALNSTRLGGSMCLVGMGAPRVDLDAYRVSTEERTIVGSFTFSDQDFRDAAAYVASAPSALSHLISREVPLIDGPEAFASLANHDGTPGKVLVRLDT
jgi:threonine dehydrogenase-like Zn-dependent dehydrogenase